MSRIIVISLFCVLLFATLLGLSMSLAPGLSVKNAYLYAIIIFLLIRGAVEHRAGGLMDEPIPLTAVHVCFVVLIAWTVASLLFMTLFAKEMQYSGLLGLIALKGSVVDLYLVFIAFFFTIRDKEDLNKTIIAIVMAVVLYNTITFLDVYTGLDFGLVEKAEGTKVWGPMGHSNQYGSFLAFFLPSMVAIAVNSRGIRRAIFAVGATLSFVLLIATLARAAYLGFFVGIVATLFLYRSFLPIVKYFQYALMAIPVAILLMLILGQWDDFYDRVVVATSRATSTDEISSGRLTIWSDIISKQMQSPVGLILGMGWDSQRQSGWFLLSPHNTYLRFYFELGIIGVSFYFAALFFALRSTTKVIRKATKMDERLLLGFTVGLCSLIVFLFFDGLSVALLFAWAYIGLMLRLVFLISRSDGEKRHVSI